MTEQSGAIVASATWEDLETLIGREFVSSWLRVDEDRIAAFETGSFVESNPNGVNLALYPEGLVEGFHLLSLLDYLVNGVSFVEDERWSGWNYGFDRVRFVSPVTTSDRIRVRGSVSSVVEKGEDRLVTYDLTLEVEGREKPGAVAQWLVYWTVLGDE
ncbi:hypothetical protein [Leifsonia xyli]|uniref:hypothetical protein n=1 Tax=Leifsonia xyli TaxID=1575 RepID=UPI003D66D813